MDSGVERADENMGEKKSVMINYSAVLSSSKILCRVGPTFAVSDMLTCWIHSAIMEWVT